MLNYVLNFPFFDITNHYLQIASVDAGHLGASLSEQ